MDQVVSITSQGQLTIPKMLRTLFGIRGAGKAIVSRVGNTIVVRPSGDFWSLQGSMASSVKLTDRQLQAARRAFGKNWARKK